MDECKNEEKREKELAQERESDTIAASVVRDLFGDEGAETFKAIFGDWF